MSSTGYIIIKKILEKSQAMTEFTAPFRSVLPVSGWPARLYMLLTLLLQCDLAVCLVIEWPEFSQRLLTLKEINFSVFGLIGYLAVSEAHLLLDYAEAHARRCHSLTAVMSSEQIAVLADRDGKVLKLGRTVEVLFTSFQVFFGFTPLAALLIRTLKPHQGGPPTHLPSVLHIYYPPVPPLNTILGRVVINVLSFYWYVMLVNFWKLNAKSLFVTFQCLVTEIELLCCSFKVMSRSHLNDYELGHFLNSAVADHERICENMKILNQVSKKIVIGFMNIYGLQLCVYLVFVTMLDELSMRLRYLFLYMVMLFIMYSISINGQRVKDMGETLRLAMWQCEWTDKPPWFRKSILLMMTRATREMIVRPYDLYTLDMNCITQIVRATYTYLNLAKKFN